MTEQTRPVVIVTGGSRGIGAAVATMLGSHKYSVAINYASDKAAARQTSKWVQAFGARAITVQADVADEEQVVAMFERVERELGPVRGLVNNAGVTGGFARVEEVTAAALARVMAVNVTGTILCAREAVRRMSTKRGGAGGSIVNVSSLVARTGGAGEWVHYAASKGAVNSFTLGLAREVAAEGVRVNAVAPGLIETELHAASGEPGRVERMSPSIPMLRGGTADEVAEAVVWLMSSAASYVTGTILEVGGGR